MTKAIYFSLAGGLAALLALSLIKRKPTMKRIPVNKPVQQSMIAPVTAQEFNVTPAQMPMIKNLSNLMQKTPIQNIPAPKPAPMPTMNADLIRKLNLAIKK